MLQSIRQAEIAQMLSRIYGAPGGTEALDVLMKYMYDDILPVWYISGHKANVPIFQRELADIWDLQLQRHGTSGPC